MALWHIVWLQSITWELFLLYHEKVMVFRFSTKILEYDLFHELFHQIPVFDDAMPDWPLQTNKDKSLAISSVFKWFAWLFTITNGMLKSAIWKVTLRTRLHSRCYSIQNSWHKNSTQQWHHSPWHKILGTEISFHYSWNGLEAFKCNSKLTLNSPSASDMKSPCSSLWQK